MKARTLFGSRREEPFRCSIPTTERKKMAAGFLVQLTIIAGLLAAATAAPAAAQDKTGAGNAPRRLTTRVDVFEPLSRHGPDAIRISKLPSWGAAWSVELYPDPRHPQQVAIGRFIEWDARSEHQTGWQWVSMLRSDYAGLAAAWDDALADSRLPPEKPNGELIVCADGSDFLVERRRAGATTWFREECPATGLARDLLDQLTDKLPFPLCWYWHADACNSLRPPGVDASPAPTNGSQQGSAN